ncbi:hypothetical protein [Oceanobacillus damuensis]|uniref:hypothetical protein n=1 Tax=Oceanobacillus damuensis TaxID=937928 RepID=UPI0008368BF7|nr:hypothetical protein [Oceanobacillus damuensis]
MTNSIWQNECDINVIHLKIVCVQYAQWRQQVVDNIGESIGNVIENIILAVVKALMSFIIFMRDFILDIGMTDNIGLATGIALGIPILMGVVIIGIVIGPKHEYLLQKERRRNNQRNMRYNQFKQIKKWLNKK